MNTETSSIWKKAFNNGLIAGALCILVMLVGLVEAFGDTYIISGLITLGDIILLAPIIMLTYPTLRSGSKFTRVTQVGISAVIGLVSGILITLRVLLGQVVDLRPMFVNASPTLFNMVMRGVGLPLGALVPPISCAIAALLTLGISLIPTRLRNDNLL